MSGTCHEKGCNKIPAFNKIRKTNRKFCFEHKKDGMVNIMYRNYNNQVDQLFKSLPRDLQWEILVDYVGGYAVRYNRLRRLMTGDMHNQIMLHNFELNPLSLYNLWAKPFVRFPFSDNDHLWISIANRCRVTSFRSDGTVIFDYNDDNEDEYDPDLLNIIAVAEFSRRDSCVVLFMSRYTDQLSYGHMFRGFNSKWYITDINDSIILPPYEKHVYPSYPYTNKKLGRPLLKMKLHNPIPQVPEGLSYNEIKKWKDGYKYLY